MNSQQPTNRTVPLHEQQSNAYHIYHDPGHSGVGATIMDAVASIAEKSVSELGPLNDIIDPDALDALFSAQPDGRPRGTGYIHFAIQNFEVSVHSNGHISIVPHEEDPLTIGRFGRNQAQNSFDNWACRF
ncbi:HalOD1 output domain-containing protein [Haladaptatus sp. GCM10025893]|uniref:HalOD1 output domain-containing protein n=1 Tax=Haladaptatus sp. GCM10025893 TaxID=3252659 RepID=UPI00361965F6